ncbi:MAG: aldehyde dehydrogenase family protein [Limnochordia bacterium]
MEAKGNWIGGAWRPSSSGEVREVRNPSNVDEVVGVVAWSTPADVAAAVESAEKAFRSWKNMPAPSRARILSKAADILAGRLEEVARLLSREQGKPIGEARGEVQRGVDLLHYYAGEGWRSLGHVIPSAAPGALMFTVREPLGVVGVITPWNFPVAIPLWKSCPALIFGNTVVLKPAADAPLTALAIASVFEEAGMPPGVFNVVTGPGSQLGDALIQHEAVKAVTFTGSNAVGAHIARQAAARGIKYQLEMGGKNAAIVLADADLDHAADVVISGAMRFAGQKCTATSRAIVERGVLDAFTEKVVERARRIAVRPATDEEAYLGPVVNEAQRQKVLEYIELGKAGEGKLAAGGGIPEGDLYARGFFVEPTVFVDVRPDARIAQEEIFGPVLSLIPADSPEQAIEIANGVKYGLSASLFTNDLTRAMQYIRDIEVGMVRVNAETAGVEFQAPFGGYKASSSYSREQGRAAIEFFTQVKTVTIAPAGGC